MVFTSSSLTYQVIMSSKRVVLLALIGLVSISCVQAQEQFLQHEVVPDAISAVPETILKIRFANGLEAELGNELTISQVASVPDLEWDYKPDAYYTLIFCDPDAPSRASPVDRSYLHWLVVNISGNDVTSGSTLTSILYSHPPPGTGLHRYLFLVYEQPSLIDFDETPDHSSDGRLAFSPEAFAAKYNLGSPVAGNFYQTQNLEEEYILLRLLRSFK